MAGNNTELAEAIRASSERLGINPSDLATVISYETGGRFDPWQKGPTTQWGEHRGLLQFGEPQRAKYGLTKDSSLQDQFGAIEGYLTDAGVRPGHGLLDIYSAVNAGRVGRYNASDANNGGAPGTVADKVANQMYGHRLRANALLGGNDVPATDVPVTTPTAAPPSGPQTMAGQLAPQTQPVGLSPAPDAAVPVSDEPAIDPAVLAALQNISKQGATQSDLQPAAPQQTINFPIPPGFAKARALALAMARRPVAQGVI